MTPREEMECKLLLSTLAYDGSDEMKQSIHKLLNEYVDYLEQQVIQAKSECSPSEYLYLKLGYVVMLKNIKNMFLSIVSTEIIDNAIEKAVENELCGY